MRCRKRTLPRRMQQLPFREPRRRRMPSWWSRRHEKPHRHRRWPPPGQSACHPGVSSEQMRARRSPSGLARPRRHGVTWLRCRPGASRCSWPWQHRTQRWTCRRHPARQPRLPWPLLAQHLRLPGARRRHRRQPLRPHTLPWRPSRQRHWHRAWQWHLRAPSRRRQGCPLPAGDRWSPHRRPSGPGLCWLRRSRRPPAWRNSPSARRRACPWQPRGRSGQPSQLRLQRPSRCLQSALQTSR